MKEKVLHLHGLFFLGIFALALTFHAPAEDRLILKVNPLGTLPIGSSSQTFDFGIGGDLNLNYSFSDSGILNLGLNLGYLYLPLESEDGISIITGGAGPRISIPVSNRFNLSLGGYAGYYQWMAAGWEVLDQSDGGGFFFGVDLAGDLSLGQSLGIRLGAGYAFYRDLYNGLTFSLGTRITLARLAFRDKPITEEKNQPQLLHEGKEGAELTGFLLNPVYPVLHKYYDSNPLGLVTLTNRDEQELNDIKVSFFVERYMDNPMDVGAPGNLAPGEEVYIDLFGLFTEDVMTITEGGKASALVKLEYSIEGEVFEREYNPVIEFYNRNAMTWDDDRKVSAFVTAKDPYILTFSRNVTNWMQEEKNSFVDENLQKAMILFQAVKEKSIRYEIDPATPFTKMSESEKAIDFLQFPRQTLSYTSGDCDDLSILFSSLLEASGVETAFITIPGHIYLGLALKMSPAQSRRNFSRSDNLIILEDKVWLPLEITMVQQDFLKAWETGAKEWRENQSKDQAVLYPTREAWQTYQAVGFYESTASVDLPLKEDVLGGFTETLEIFISREIYPQVSKIETRIREEGEQPRFRNQLGVLYAKYGMLERAEDEFRQITRTQEYLPALVNLGNIYYAREDYLRALPYLERAEMIDRENKTVVLTMAKVHHQLENYGMVRQKYGLLEDIAPDLAEDFAYLDLRGDEAARAAEAGGINERIVWEEVE